MKALPYILSLSFLLTLFWGCNPEVEVFAIEKELYLVNGVLNQNAEEQFIRVSKVFQTEGDAILFAAENDVTLNNLQVRIEGGGKVYEAEAVSNLPRDPGVFPREQSIYRFETAGADSLIAGERYDLYVRKPGDSTFLITAYTDIPTTPLITSPGAYVYSPADTVFTYNTIDFTGDFVVRFNASSGHGYEVRVTADFWDGREMKTAQWGPTRVFQEPVGCTGNINTGKMCYEIRERIVPISLLKYTRDAPGPIAFYDTVRIARQAEQLSQNTRIEVTAIDTFLTTYLRAETAFGFGANLLMDKPAVTNISGENVGIFGSINTSWRYLFLSSCTKFVAGFSPSGPNGC